jgi:hypothetical protein
MFWVLSLVQWMVGGDIDGLTGVVAICAGFGLGMLAMFPPLPILSPISFVVLVGTMILYPFVRSALDRRELRSVDVETLERTYETLGQRPLNPSARFRLATCLWTLGLPENAIAIAEESLKNMPVQHFRDEHRQLASWKTRPASGNRPQPLECPQCGRVNPASEIYCQGCGAPFLLLRVRRRFVPGNMGRRLIAAWVAMVAVLVGIPASTALPPMLTVLTILVLLAAIVVVIWLAFRPMLEEAA